jgi:hypothetical protein
VRYCCGIGIQKSNPAKHRSEPKRFLPVRLMLCNLKMMKACPF